ncbi:MAG: hypothetical protein HY321_21820 [Armatimonadetes bacterium]|nr:hypothetical protein [Armatimonadota bacterium]
MGLEFKPDWEETKERWRAWWAREYIGRCALAVTAPRADAPDVPPPVPLERVEDRWLDFAYRMALCDWRMRRSFYGGEAIPNWNSGYSGWNSIPTYLGCPIVLDEGTGWWDPILTEGKLTDHDFRALTVHPRNAWWRRARAMLRAAAEASRGRCVVGVGAFGGCGDTLAALRGTMRLLEDVMDYPDYVREFELYLMRQWTEVFDALHAITREVTQGSTCWNDAWSPGKHYVAQCDFSYMISPRTFRDLFLPAIEPQTRFLDHCTYHVDGVPAYVHIDALLELPRIQCLQIMPGAGKPSAIHWLEMLRRIQAAGKNLELHLSPDEVRTALAHLSARGLYIRAECRSEAEAQELLRDAERWSRDRG